MNAEDYDFLRTYGQSIAKIPVLSTEEELVLGKQIKRGNKGERQSAIDKIITHNLRYAFSRANDFHRSHSFRVSLSDITQMANEGLLYSAPLFDYKRGNRFITYAHKAISNHMMRGVRGYLELHVPEKVFDSFGGNQKSHEEACRYLLGLIFVSKDDENAKSVVSSLAQYVSEKSKLTESINRALKNLDEEESKLVDAVFGLTRGHAPITNFKDIRGVPATDVLSKALSKLKELPVMRDALEYACAQ